MPFFKVSDLEARELIPGMSGRFVHSDAMTTAYWEIQAGAILPEHSHPHEQVCNVIEGLFELTIAGQSQRMSAGDIAVIPSDTLHAGKALSDCRIIDVFQPVREDYRAK